MKRRRSLFIHLSQIRLLIKRFALVLLFVLAFSLLIFDRTENALLDKGTVVANNFISPVINVLIIPARILARSYNWLSELTDLYAENNRLKDENESLLVVNSRVRALEIENEILSDLMNYRTPDEISFITAKIMAEEADAFSHSVVAYVEVADRVKKGQVALSDKGVIGRVDKVGPKYSKIILATDINSHIPVMVERTRVRGMLTGDNTLVPKMEFIPLEAELTVGDRVVTSGVAGVFPSGLPVGKIISVEKNNVRIKLFTPLERLEYVKIVNYGLSGVVEEVSADEAK